MKEKFEHSQLFAGEVGDIVRVYVENSTVHRGDVLAIDDMAGKIYIVPDGLLDADKPVVIAAETVENYTGEIVAYATGHFDYAQVKLNGAPVATDNRNTLKLHKIFLEDTI